MDLPEESSLGAALRDVPDPRRPRGQRHAWPRRLTLIAAALASGQRRGRAIGQWVDEPTAALVAALAPPRGRLPSPATRRRAVRAVDVVAVAARLAAVAAGLPAPPGAAAGGWVGVAMDGQAVRGATRHGAAVHRVRRVRHGAGRVLGQVAVAATSNAIAAAPRRLAGRALAGVGVTMDAPVAQRALARPIRAQRGHDLLIATANQPAWHATIAGGCAPPPPPLATDAPATTTCTAHGHGRRETRPLDRTAARTGSRDGPAVGPVRRRACRRVSVTTGDIQADVTDGVTSRPIAAPAAAVDGCWRGHGTIEHRVHDGRDVTWGEDAGQPRVGHAPQALAALRNGRLSLLRARGWASIADALRQYGAAPHRALHRLAASPPRL